MTPTNAAGTVSQPGRRSTASIGDAESSPRRLSSSRSADTLSRVAGRARKAGSSGPERRVAGSFDFLLDRVRNNVQAVLQGELGAKRRRSSNLINDRRRPRQQITTENYNPNVPSSFGAGPLNRARVADQIVSDLQQRIARGELERGSRLPAERELAQSYQVSPPTIREALRVLSSMGLIEVRRGSGAYVAESSKGLLDAPLSMIVRWENIGVDDLLGLLRMLHLHAAELAAQNATPEEIERVTAAARATTHFTTIDDLVGSFYRFLATFVAAAHQPLLDALCGFLTGVLLRLEREYHPTQPKYWKDWASSSGAMRLEIAEALHDQDRDLLLQRMEAFHANIRERLMRIPGIRDAHVG